MTLSKNKHGSAAAVSFRISPVAIGCALLIVGTAATAQEAAAPQQLETVTVTGIRKGIEAAISVKRNSDSIVEAISAEDIGKLPDSSIAESIARLPGLTAQRVNGRAQEVQIRGLAGQFATTLLNGREQVSTGDNRSAEFDQYPSELLSGVTIYKTPDGALVGQGLSGTIDLQTVRPLNFSGRTMAINLRGEKNSLGRLNPGGAGDKGNRFSFSYIDQFADRTVGVALGYARLDSPNQNNYFRNWGYPSIGTDPANPTVINGVTYNNVRVPGGVQIRNESASQERSGLMGVLQWKPSKDFETVVDVYHSTYERSAIQRGFEAGLAWGAQGLNNPVVEGGTRTGNVQTGGVLTQGDWLGVKPILRHDLNDREDTISAVGWNSKLVVSPALTLTGDLSWSKADREESIMELYAGTVPGSTGALDTFKVNFPAGGGLPTLTAGLNYADPAIIKLVDSGGWGQAGYLKKPKVEDEIKSVRVAARVSQDFGFFTGGEFGLNFTQRQKSRNINEWFMDLKTTPTTIPAGMLSAPNSLGFVGLGNFISYDAHAAAAQFYNLRVHDRNRDIINKNWIVKEDITTIFAKADIDTELLGMPLRGNLGLQGVNAKQKSTAFTILNAALDTAPVTRGINYTDWLPSLNLTWQVASNQNVRFGLARQITRPRMDDMRATQEYSVDNGRAIWTGNGGNPELKPWKADAVDLSYEYYFGSKGYVSVAGYYKDLKTYIYSQRLNINFKDRFGTLTPPGSVTPTSDIGEFTTQSNGQGGSLSGVELAVSLPLSMVANVLDGFGVQASYAYVESKIAPFGPADARPLPGLSPNTYNLTAYYEKSGFSARVSTRIRDNYVAEVTGFGADRAFEYAKKEQVTDLQLGYEFQGGAAKGLSVVFQINNVGNEPYVEYYNNDLTQTRQYTRYGKTYLFGVNYKF
ncbi:TonB-dependent receptor [Roseateles sp. LYH14W]|uniref:TonB-dependent receptor n=1 Tax=Pelomonas parva TaxID=3299032 RepID=A0ABW7EXG6_9BURK